MVATTISLKKDHLSELKRTSLIRLVKNIRMTNPFKNDIIDLMNSF